MNRILKIVLIIIFIIAFILIIRSLTSSILKQYKKNCGDGYMMGENNECRKICDTDKDQYCQGDCTHPRPGGTDCVKCDSGKTWTGQECKENCNLHGTYNSITPGCDCYGSQSDVYPPVHDPNCQDDPTLNPNFPCKEWKKMGLCPFTKATQPPGQDPRQAAANARFAKLACCATCGDQPGGDQPLDKPGGWEGKNCQIPKNKCINDGKPGAPKDLLSFPLFKPSGKITEKGCIDTDNPQWKSPGGKTWLQEDSPTFWVSPVETPEATQRFCVGHADDHEVLRYEIIKADKGTECDYHPDPSTGAGYWRLDFTFWAKLKPKSDDAREQLVSTNYFTKPYCVLHRAVGKTPVTASKISWDSANSNCIQPGWTYDYTMLVSPIHQPGLIQLCAAYWNFNGINIYRLAMMPSSLPPPVCSGHGILANINDYTGCECVCDAGWGGKTCNILAKNDKGAGKCPYKCYNKASVGHDCQPHGPDSCVKGVATYIKGVCAPFPQGCGDYTKSCQCAAYTGPLNFKHKCVSNTDCIKTEKRDLGCAGDRVQSCETIPEEPDNQKYCTCVSPS